MWVISEANVDLKDSSPPFDQVYLVCTQRKADNDKDLIHSKSDLLNVITSCEGDHQFSKDDFERVGEFELAAECAQVVLQC